MKLTLAYGLALTFFLVLDGIWLGYLAKDLYLSRMAPIMLERPRLGVAALFYIAFVAGLLYFVIAPALASGDWRGAALNGALFGFFAYLTYDATGYAVIRGFDPALAVVDVIWGSFLAATVSGLTVRALHVLGTSS
ncbi:MAG TPA: DUF2177 family protein [Candidatus Macondimonas sp.]|nr:DUF2177 family protein [Candidatus Macondimonas sp.]